MAGPRPLVVSVEPSWRRSRCRTCGERPQRYDRQPVRDWRHLSWGRAQVTDRTSVSHLLRISWGTVGSIVKRVVARRLVGARFSFHSAYALTLMLFLCCGEIELARRPYPHSFVRRP